MRQIDAVGFDMDWTLAQYNVEFDLLAYNGAKEKLVNWLGEIPLPSTLTHFSVRFTHFLMHRVSKRSFVASI